MIEHIRQIFFSPTHLVMGKAWNRVVKTAGKPKAHLSKIATEEATENYLGNSHPQRNPMHV